MGRTIVSTFDYVTDYKIRSFSACYGRCILSLVTAHYRNMLWLVRNTQQDITVVKVWLLATLPSTVVDLGVDVSLLYSSLTTTHYEKVCVVVSGKQF